MASVAYFLQWPLQKVFYFFGHWPVALALQEVHHLVEDAVEALLHHFQLQHHPPLKALVQLFNPRHHPPLKRV